MLIGKGIALIVLIITHLLGGKLRFLEGIPRSKWLSIAGGTSVSFVFLHVLPELQHFQIHLAEQIGWEFLVYEFYLISLVGLLVYYGIERAAKLKGDSRRSEENEDQSDDALIFYIHIASFSIYNGLIGLLLGQKFQESTSQLILFTVAMGLHFIVTDHFLTDHYKKEYLKRGRWMLITALIAGFILCHIVPPSDLLLGIMFSFIAGGMVLNVLKEELPEERQSNYLAFISGAAAYAALLLFLE